MLSCFSLIQLFVNLWTIAHQAPLSMGSPGKNAGVGCCALLQGIFLTQGANPCLKSPALACGFFTTSTTWEAHFLFTYVCVCVYIYIYIYIHMYVYKISYGK